MFESNVPLPVCVCNTSVCGCVTSVLTHHHLLHSLFILVAIFSQDFDKSVHFFRYYFFFLGDSFIDLTAAILFLLPCRLWISFVVFSCVFFSIFSSFFVLFCSLNAGGWDGEWMDEKIPTSLTRNRQVTVDNGCWTTPH